VTGMAGDAGADGGMGGHAWSMVQLDGIWYEVDSTWDDFTSLKDDVEAAFAPTSIEYQVYMEMLNDTQYMDRVLHYMYLITTEEIEDYKPSDDLVYTTKNGVYRVTLVGESQRERFSTYKDTKDTFQGIVVSYLPVADGTVDPDWAPEDEGGEEDVPDETEEGESTAPTAAPTAAPTEAPTEAATQAASTGKYKAIAGTYYVSNYNGYSEAILRTYYGNDYYKMLAMFQLNADGTGVLTENGSSIPFTFSFDGTYLIMMGQGGGCLYLAYSGGSFLMYDSYWNVYVFSKMK